MQDNEKTRKMEETEMGYDGQTRIMDDNEDTKINPAAPMSEESMKKSPWAQRVGLGVAGVALAGGIAGAGISAFSSNSSSDSKLSTAAEPDLDDNTPADSVDIKFDDPNDLPNSVGSANNETSTTNDTDTNDSAVNGEVSTAAHSVEHNQGFFDKINGHIDMLTGKGAHHANNHHHNVHHVELNADEHIHHHVYHHVYHHDVHSGVARASDIVLPDNSVHYAIVDDDMSFAQAFASARAQVGPGGIFYWRGGSYGTYYAEEWNHMDHGDRASYLAQVHFPDEFNSDAPIVDYDIEPSIEDQTVQVELEGMSFPENGENYDEAMMDSNNDLADNQVVETYEEKDSDSLPAYEESYEESYDDMADNQVVETYEDSYDDMADNQVVETYEENDDSSMLAYNDTYEDSGSTDNSYEDNSYEYQTVETYDTSSDTFDGYDGSETYDNLAQAEFDGMGDSGFNDIADAGFDGMTEV